MTWRFFALLFSGCLASIVDHPTLPDDAKQHRFPDAIIIGSKKSGTRALIEFLRQHPNVVAKGKEVHFFDRFWTFGSDFYKNSLPEANSSQILIEKTPGYFNNPEVPQRVASLMPKVKLILILKDPIERLLSDYAQSKTKPGSKSNSASFEKLLLLRNGSINGDWPPVRLGKYSQLLGRWLRFFPLKQFLIISGEDLIDEPAIVMKSVQKFLNLPPIIDESFFYFNSTKGFYCLAKLKAKRKKKCLGRTKGRKHETIRSDLKEKLELFYAPFNSRLLEMTNVTLSWMRRRST